jgi:hypothetical protein
MLKVRRALFAGTAVAALALATIPAGNADTEKQLQRVRGTVGYQTAANSNDFKAVFGKFNLPDDDYAVTRAASSALVVMPDSSLIQLGEFTSVQVGAFNAGAAGPGSTITVNGGALRFDIRRPQGGAANYRFTTATSQIAVRGTIGLLAFSNGITTVGCLVCAADSVVVTVGGQTVPLLAGQVITISATGAITTSALGSTVTAGFSGAGVSTSSASGAAGAGAGAAGAGAATGTIAGAAAAAGVAAGVAASNSAKASPSPQPTPTATATASASATPTASAASPTPTPVPTATPTGQPGTAVLTGHGRSPFGPPPGTGPATAPGGRSTR